MKGFDHKSGGFLEIEGAKIYYEITGNMSAPVLLLLHGGFGNIEDFNDTLENMDDEFQVIGMDSRGQGKSTLGPKELTYEMIQKDVEQILQHLNIDTLNILGFSDGGIVGYRLASFTGLKINKLITVGSRWHFKNVEPMKKIFSGITGFSFREMFPPVYEAYKKLNPEPDFDKLVPQLLKMWLDTSDSGCPNEHVKNISCPILIVRGDDDKTISRMDVVELSEIVNSSRILNIPFSGHATHTEQREIFLISLKEFLKENPLDIREDTLQ
jgi:pimeloyl-ACP methyl ester carboxylesterase